jgi:hypothetical protein
VTGTLSLAILKTRGSYVNDVIEEAPENPERDTLQIWMGQEMTFHILTYSLDHDIHIYAHKTKPNQQDLLESIDEKNYGDLIERRIRIQFDDTNDPEEVRLKFAEHGLEPTIVIKDAAFIFWRYGDAKYKTIPGAFPELENRKLSGTLILTILGVRGNYHEGLYLDSEENPHTDTAQWWISDQVTYATLTFAMTQTMRVMKLNKPAEEMLRLAYENNAKLQSSIVKQVQIDFENVFDRNEVLTKFGEHGLDPTLAIYEDSIPIWTYQGIEYSFDDKAQGTPNQVPKSKFMSRIRHWFNARG